MIDGHAAQQVGVRGEWLGPEGGGGERGEKEGGKRRECGEGGEREMGKRYGERERE